jgi:RNA polymerase sigma-70 factor, ECF subfamily
MTTIAIIQKAETANSTDLIQSFENIITENENKIFNTILSFIGDYEDALDLTQETFLYAFRNVRKFRQESSISTWLYTIAINLCKKNYNNKKRFTSLFSYSLDDPEITLNIMNCESKDQPADEILVTGEEQKLINKAISSLPKKYRTVIILKYLQDLSYDEIAQIVGCNVGTVKSRLSRAKEKLKPMLKHAMEVAHAKL